MLRSHTTHGVVQVNLCTTFKTHQTEISILEILPSSVKASDLKQFFRVLLWCRWSGHKVSNVVWLDFWQHQKSPLGYNSMIRVVVLASCYYFQHLRRVISEPVPFCFKIWLPSKLFKTLKKDAHVARWSFDIGTVTFGCALNSRCGQTASFEFHIVLEPAGMSFEVAKVWFREISNSHPLNKFECVPGH